MNQGIPSNSDILALLAKLDTHIADDLESQWLDFKPWTSPKDDVKIAVEYAVCFANAAGGVVVFGVDDHKKGRVNAIHGAAGYDLDLWRKAIFDGARPNLNVELCELAVPEGTGKLLIVRIPKGDTPPYGTSKGLFKHRVGKDCMPLDAQGFSKAQIATGSVDWSGALANGIKRSDLDPLELARARAILRGKNPDSDLLKASDEEFLKGIGAMRSGSITHTGLLLFGKSEVLVEACPQNQIHYVFQASETKATRNDIWQVPLLLALERIEQIFSSPANPEEELSLGLFKLRVPAFPLDSVREGLLNAVTHRDYSNPGEILVRHSQDSLVITSPGRFIGGITLKNILSHEPVPRNRTLANAFVKLRLVESAGMGRRRIFIPPLSFGKPSPKFSADKKSVSLHLFNTGYSKEMAALISRLNQDGYEMGFGGLMILNYLREHPFIDVAAASVLLQIDRDEARSVLDRLSVDAGAILERKGHTKSATFHLAKEIGKQLLGKAAYSRNRGINPIRYAEMVREYLRSHRSITNRECRELLGLGESPSAQVEASRYLKKWSEPGQFLVGKGEGKSRKYSLRSRS